MFSLSGSCEHLISMRLSHFPEIRCLSEFDEPRRTQRFLIPMKLWIPRPHPRLFSKEHMRSTMLNLSDSLISVKSIPHVDPVMSVATTASYMSNVLFNSSEITDTPFLSPSDFHIKRKTPRISAWGRMKTWIAFIFSVSHSFFHR